MDSVSHPIAEHNGHDMTSMTDPRIAELMAIHDSIMPQMSTIMDLKLKLKNKIAKLDTLNSSKPADGLKAKKKQALAMLTKLEVADNSMMNWMHQYKADTLINLDPEKKTAYLTEQKQKIEIVRDQMKKSISDARELINIP